MRFLVDRCAGQRLADSLRGDGHDVLEVRTLGPDPGDRPLLELAESLDRVLITIDSDFGELIYLHDVPHAGLVRLPDVPAERRIALMAEVLEHHRSDLEGRAVVTVGGRRIASHGHRRSDRRPKPPVMRSASQRPQFHGPHRGLRRPASRAVGGR